MKPSCVLLLVLVLSTADRASAQQPQSPEDAPRQSLPSPPLLPANEGTPPPSPADLRENEESQELGFLPRAGIGLLGGIGGGLVGAGAGALIGHGAAAPVGCVDELCSGARLSGAYAGALLGVPAGTYFAGEHAGGRGTYVSALTGSLVGWSLVAVGQFFVVSENGIGDAKLKDAPGLALLLTLPVVGSSLGYQYSHARAGRETSRPTSAMGARLLLEFLLGGTGGAVVGFGGLIGGLGAGTCGLTDACSSDGDDLAVTSVILTSFTVGTSLGVYGAGVLVGGRGSYLPTLAGGVLGVVTGAAVFYSNRTPATLALLLGGPLVGSIVGYEVSHGYAPPGPERPPVSPRAETGIHWVPVIAATPAGGLLGGLAGRF